MPLLELVGSWARYWRPMDWKGKRSVFTACLAASTTAPWPTALQRQQNCIQSFHFRDYILAGPDPHTLGH